MGIDRFISGYQHCVFELIVCHIDASIALKKMLDTITGVTVAGIFPRYDARMNPIQNRVLVFYSHLIKKLIIKRRPRMPVNHVCIFVPSIHSFFLSVIPGGRVSLPPGTVFYFRGSATSPVLGSTGTAGSSATSSISTVLAMARTCALMEAMACFSAGVRLRATEKVA